MSEERVIEALLSAIARRDATIRECASTLRGAVQREEREEATIRDLEARFAVCREEADEAISDLNDARATIDRLKKQIDEDRREINALRDRANDRMTLHVFDDGSRAMMPDTWFAKGLAFALAIAEYRAAAPEPLYERVHDDRCPECLVEHGYARSQCEECAKRSPSYCMRHNCLRNPDHDGPCRGFA